MQRTRPLQGVPISTCVAGACATLSVLWVSAEQAVRVERLLQRFEVFASAAFGVVDIHDVSPEIAEGFIWAVDANNRPPADVAAHLRRTALRLLFRIARQTDPSVGDPTLDLTMPARPRRITRPLTDDEVTLCRAASVWSLEDTRRSAAWALAEATCRTGELPYIRVGDLDLDQKRVWLHGGRRQSARWGELSEWGAERIRFRATAGGADASTPLLYAGSDPREAGRVSTSTALLDVLRRTGLAEDPSVRPQSITGWAGVQIMERTGRIDRVAAGLGLKSLDRAASMIDWSWQDETT